MVFEPMGRKLITKLVERSCEDSAYDRLAAMVQPGSSGGAWCVTLRSDAGNAEQQLATNASSRTVIDDRSMESEAASYSLRWCYVVDSRAKIPGVSLELLVADGSVPSFTPAG